MAEAAVWEIVAGAFILGGAVGLGIGYFVLAPGRKRAARLEKELEDRQREHTEYREQVTGSYVKTAELLNAMTQSYRQVHEHLASSARDLCGEQLAGDRFEQLARPTDIGKTIEHADIKPAPALTEREQQAVMQETPGEPVDSSSQPAEPMSGTGQQGPGEPPPEVSASEPQADEGQFPPELDETEAGAQVTMAPETKQARESDA